MVGKSYSTSKEKTTRFITETCGSLGVKKFVAPFGSLIDIVRYGTTKNFTREAVLDDTFQCHLLRQLVKVGSGIATQQLTRMPGIGAIICRDRCPKFVASSR